MIIANTIESAYPFLSSCDLDLGTGNKLERGVILNASLYPAADANYAYIAGIYRKDLGIDRFGVTSLPAAEVGVIEVRADDNTLLCTVEFDISEDVPQILVGTAYQQGRVCGCICASPSLLPILRARYIPNKRSFIFTPAVFRPRPARAEQYNLCTAAGNVINDVVFAAGADGSGSSGLLKDADGNIFIKSDTDHASVAPSPVQEIVLVMHGGTTLSLSPSSGSNVNIRSGKGCGLRVVPTTDGLLLGGYGDV